MNLKSTTKRLVTLWKRKQRARLLGFHFKRAAAFVLPATIRIGTKQLNLRLPNDGGTRTAFMDVLLDDCYRLEELPDNIQTVVDIGCHAGLFSIAARNRWPRAVIHAYEPNVALKVYWEHHAAQAEFLVYGEAVGVASASVALESNIETVLVRTIETSTGTIPQVAFREVLARIGDSVDLIKMDCEGAEWPILRDEESWNQARFLTMEFHLWAGYTVGELKARLSKMGFRIRHFEFTGPDFGVLLAGR